MTKRPETVGDSHREQRVRDFTRSCVRSGLMTDEQLVANVEKAIRAELPERAESAGRLAHDWVERDRDELVSEQDGWPEATDYDRLQTAFSELETLDVLVVQGVEDLQSARDELQRRAATSSEPTGIVWFTPSDVWHAVGKGVLRVHLVRGTTQNVPSNDELLDDVLTVFDKHGIPAKFAHGRIEVAARWQRRIAGHVKHGNPVSDSPERPARLQERDR